MHGKSPMGSVTGTVDGRNCAPFFRGFRQISETEQQAVLKVGQFDICFYHCWGIVITCQEFAFGICLGWVDPANTIRMSRVPEVSVWINGFFGSLGYESPTYKIYKC